MSASSGFASAANPSASPFAASADAMPNAARQASRGVRPASVAVAVLVSLGDLLRRGGWA